MVDHVLKMLPAGKHQIIIISALAILVTLEMASTVPVSFFNMLQDVSYYQTLQQYKLLEYRHSNQTMLLQSE